MHSGNVPGICVRIKQMRYSGVRPAAACENASCLLYQIRDIGTQVSGALWDGGVQQFEAACTLLVLAKV